LILNDELDQNNSFWDKYVELADYLDRASKAIMNEILSNVNGNLNIVPRPLKSNETLKAKIPRFHGKINRIHDLAGIRVVSEMTLTEQNVLVEQIKTVLGDNFFEIKDRRIDPKSGYRAVHIIAQVDKIYVEIQIRTSRQHSWADFFERVADVYGRQIRYDGDPNGASADQIEARREFVKELQAWSLVHIAAVEQSMDTPGDHHNLKKSLNAEAVQIQKLILLGKKGD